MKPLVQKTIEIAQSRVGIREIGRSNRGPEVDGFARDTGVSSGQPWCAMFTYSNKHDAAEELGVENPYIRSAYTPTIYNWAKSLDILIPNIGKNGKINLPEAGDDFLVMGPTRIYHTGHVQEVEGHGFWKIEGNSNSEGSNEGYKVARNFTKFSPRYYFVRWSTLVSATAGLPLTRKLYLGGQLADPAVPVKNNVTLVPLYKWIVWTRLQGKFMWKNGTDTPIWINNKPVETEITLLPDPEGNLRPNVSVRDLVDLDPTLAIDYDTQSQSVFVTRVPLKARA